MRADDNSLDLIFRRARTRNGWEERPVPEALMAEIYGLARMGPTSANSNPARFIWVASNEARLRLAACALGANAEKILAAPVTVIIARDLDFADNMPRLFPHAPHMEEMFRNPAIGAPTAVRNTTLQGAYLMVAARALGLDCGPMSGFDPSKVKSEFLREGNLEPDFLCSLGFGNDENLHPRSPRLDFAQANRVV